MDLGEDAVYTRSVLAKIKNKKMKMTGKVDRSFCENKHTFLLWASILNEWYIDGAS